MKTKLYIFTIVIVLFGITACDPIEDTDLRDEFAKTGTPITSAELTAALSVTQPISNSDDKVEGDQYVVVHNNRPDIPGTWFVQTATGVVQYHTDHDTIIYGSNNTYDIYFVGLSEKQAVRSETFTVTITNCFDEYMTFLSGAKDKADKTAKKTWKLLNHPLAFYNGMYGAWKYYDMSPGQRNYQSGASVLTTDDFGKYMVFEIAGSKLTIYDKTDAVLSSGGWGFTHDDRGEEIDGELICSTRLIGTEKAWQTYSGTSTPYYILSIDENNMILCLPGTYNRTGDDWDYNASYYFFTAIE
ncbi:MAG: hypothetical protein LBH19_14605 [Dysgonamonadaceae bacterium]|jgi:hypothetical protein|nr:hypothetical protein [Dysgonamonadaceae bacterium]